MDLQPPSMETVYEAIAALFENPDVKEKERASRWLQELQRSVHSWKIGNELLQQKKSVASCYFGAQTIRSKIQHNLSELPPDSLTSLRDSLISYLEAIDPIADSCDPTLTQLCVGLADLALQMSSWNNCVTDLIQLFSSKNNLVLLEILTAIPQEVDFLELGENRREEIKSGLRAIYPNVGEFLKGAITNANNTLMVSKIIKCMTSWIELRLINLQDIPQNTVISYAFQILRDHSSTSTLHEVSTECISALLRCIEEDCFTEDVEKLLFESVANLENSYHLAVANENEEQVVNYTRVFTELAENFLRKILATAAGGGTHFAFRSLDLVLICVGHHDYEVSMITFYVWYRLSEEVYTRDYHPLTDCFKPHIQRLVAALARQSQCDPDQTHLPEEGEDFYEFRRRVTDLIKDVVFIVSSSSIFRQMFAALQGNISWEQTEAALFVMQAVAKNILPEEYEVVPKVVEAILSMPENTHRAVRKTCLMLLGELCEWIDHHPECLDSCLQCLLKALHDQQLASAAASALQSICSACRQHMNSHVSGLLSLAQGLITLPLTTDSNLAVLRGLASSIGWLAPAQMALAMREVICMQLAPLSELLKSPNAEVKKGSDNDPVRWLDRVAAVFRNVQPKSGVLQNGLHPCTESFVDTWNVLQHVLDKYASLSRVVERLCRALRFGIRCVGHHASPLLEVIAQKMAVIYKAHHHSCLLYLAGILVDEMAEKEECVPLLLVLLQALMPHAFTLLQAKNGLRNNPDTVDDLFRLCIRFLQRTPLQLLTSDALPTILGCARLAVTLDHRDANASVMNFLFDFTRSATNHRNQIKEISAPILLQFGEELTKCLMEASVLHLHPHMLGEPAEILVELIQWRRGGDRWLRTALEALPRDRPAAATEQQCLQFYQCAISAKNCKEMTKLLRDFAKLYR